MKHLSTQEVHLVERAKAYAIEAHAEVHQTRKYSGEPYHFHLAQVVELLEKSDTYPAETLAAAWLHDSVEDTNVTVADIRKIFGDKVAKYVDQLTDMPVTEGWNRARRKTHDLETLSRSSDAIQSIKLANLISNAPSIIEHDPHFAPVFMQEAKQLLDTLVHGNQGLRLQLRSILEEYHCHNLPERP